VAKARVLLVEDDRLQADVTTEMLRKSGYDVSWANDGISAIKMVKASKPDIILLDLMLPGLDGYEVCRWLKLEEATKGIPVIMLTIKKELSDKISGLQIGADDFLPKPYDELELNARIYASLRTKSLQDELKTKNKQLEDLLYKVEYMAITDALTGLYNRRRFHDVLTKEFERSKRYTNAFSIIMLDLDHFKPVNDDYGHQAGDTVLKEIAKILLKSIREIDTVSRYGGEEFVLLLPNTNKEGAFNLAERIRNAIEKNRLACIENREVTASIGISGVPDADIDTEDKLIRCADFALYQAKRNGRNRIETATGKDLQTAPGNS
jgi:diguanylate cyclase (GGDEF)-like protein